MSKRKQTPQERYAAKYKKQFKIDCITTTEKDIIEKLESVPNKAGYIKQLIRADIAASNTKEKNKINPKQTPKGQKKSLETTQLRRFKAKSLVRETGLEPVRDYHTPLKRARLPIPPLSHSLVVPSRNVAYYIKSFSGCQALIGIFPNKPKYPLR